MYPHLSVRETLLLAANFYLPDDTSKDAKDELITDIIMELGLRKCAETNIGNNRVRGISGGERKRASIAVQLISDPAVLFLDEPTSGLDAFQAQSVMECMKNLAASGRLVISVIHQPRSSIFSMFDQLLLLSEGHGVYLGQADLADEYFNRIGYCCPIEFNPADYFLDILSPDNRSEEKIAQSSARIIELATRWENESQMISAKEEKSNQKGYEKDITAVISASRTWSRTYTIFSLLCWRSWSEAVRNKFANIIKLFTSVLFSLILGGIYSNSGHGQKAYHNHIGILFFVLINNVFANVLGVLNTFPREKVIVNRYVRMSIHSMFIIGILYYL